ncbi:MAG TPA: hypothetical protein VM802_04385 [Chitinophaga sp.]|uniref:hypothetical protein n=1 Tax=Chitinophaga sp. TaxID=1869181 RepID=UPI002C2588F4|nr:hypothetical protein [Chitinophaga sp.]HVI44076.1 hypothetical protein [Chitinophaga sp.]
MLGRYFQIAIRNLLKNKGTAVLNIAGLATGMAVALLVGLWVYDEVTYNRYHRNYDTIADVMMQSTYNGTVRTQPEVPIPLRDELANKYGSYFQRISLSTYPDKHVLTYGDKMLIKTGRFMQTIPFADFLVDIPVISGRRAFHYDGHRGLPGAESGDDKPCT